MKVGVTGGIGSGKTIVCAVFEKLGIPVFNADKEAKNIVASDPGVREKIRTTFGDAVFSGGEPDRKKLAAIVFSDPEALKKLNNIIHPAVKIKFEHWAELNLSAPYVIKEAAILFESGSDAGMDKIITVTAPEALRLKRTLKRDNAAEEDIKKRMAQQLSDEEKITRSDFVIWNDDKTLVIPQILEIHKKLTAGNI
jgi:dephospho-CoA kinase